MFWKIETGKMAAVPIPKLQNKLDLIYPIRYNLVMKHWNINYFFNINGNSPVKEWIDELSDESKAEIFKVFELLKKYGIELGLPFVKCLESKIYEVRTKDKSGIYRVLYFAHTDRTFVLLHGFKKKTQATPRKEIDIAIKRMKEVQNG